MVEHFLAKEDVARSNRVTRSIFCTGLAEVYAGDGQVANALEGSQRNDVLTATLS